VAEFPTFRLTDAHDDELEIERDNDYGVAVASIRTEGGNCVYVKREESPAVAVAILEAAQAHNLDGRVAQAIICLRGHLEQVAAEKAAAEKAAEEEARLEERRKVDAVALVGLNSFRKASMGMSPLDSLDGVDPFIADAWREAVKAIEAAKDASA